MRHEQEGPCDLMPFAGRAFNAGDALEINVEETHGVACCAVLI